MTRRWLVMMVHVTAAAVAVTGHAAEPTSDDQDGNTAAASCEPACEPSQTCVDGVCLIPVPRQQAQPIPADLPPGYAQPSYSPQAATAAAPTVEPRRRGFLALPFIGVHSYRNSSGRSPGARFGSFLGGRFNETVSLSGQVTFDISNMNSGPGYTNLSESAFDLAVSPLFHVPAGAVEIVLGPKLGVFAIENQATIGGIVATSSLSGVSAGLNAGVFFPISPSALLGVMASYDLRKIGQFCQALSGEAERCSTEDEGDAIRMASLSGGALF